MSVMSRQMVQVEGRPEPVLVDVQAESSVLGSVLIDPRAIERIGTGLRPEHFVLPENQMIYATMLHLWEQRKPADLITVSHELQARGELERCGDMAYIVALPMVTPTAINAEHYARIVIGMARQRRIDDIKREIRLAGSDEMPELLDQMREAMAENDDSSELESLEPGLTAMNERLDRLKDGQVSGVLTGFRSLDAKLGGWDAGDLIILAARTSQGKTAFATNIMHNLLVKQKRRVCLFSLEMSAEQIAERMVGLDASIPSMRTKLRDPGASFTDEELRRYASSQGKLANLPLRMESKGTISIKDMKRKVYKDHRANRFDLVIVDYLQLMTPDKSEQRYQEISKISGGLKQLARELELPVLALAQLNRQPDMRTNHEPMLADLRDSGSIEQDADMVILIYRDETYNPDTDKPGIADVFVAKNRNGPTGQVELFYDQGVMRFGDVDRRRD